MRTTSRRRPLLLLAVILGGLVPSFVFVAKPLHVSASSAYETAALADSPSLYYRLNESSGTTATDDSGNSVTGTYPASAITYSVTGALNGDADTAITTTSGTSAVTASDSSLPSGASARTMEVWLKTTSNPASTSGGGSYTILMLYGNSSAAGQWAGLYLFSATSLAFGDGTDTLYFTMPYAINDGTWHQLGVSFDGGSTVRGLLDGQIVGQQSTSGSPNTVVGNGANAFHYNLDGLSGSNALNASLDEAAVYPSALSAADLNAHWQTGLNASACPSSPTSGYEGAVQADSPSRYYELGEGSGNVAYDYSGNCRDAAYTPSGVSHVSGALVGDSTGGAGTASSSGVMVTAGGDGLPTGASSRTMDKWIKTSANPASATGGYVILMLYGTDGTATASGLYLFTSTSFGMGFANDTVTFTSPYALNDGAWHELTVTYNGSLAKGYVDSRYISSGTPPTTPNTTLAQWGLMLGGYSGGTYGLNGSIDHAAVYPTALPDARIKAHWMASGNNIGLTGGALTSLQMGAGGRPYCIACHGGELRVGGATRYPINTENGEFWHDFTDIAIGGRGYPLDFERTYSSLDAANNGPLGYGWMSNTGMSLALTGSPPNRVATITQENGSQATFDEPGAGNVWTATAPRFIATLTYNSGSSTWTFVRQAKDTFTFNSSGQLTAATDLNGNTTTYAYTTAKLSSITDAASRSLAVNWTGSNITSVVDANVTPNRTVTYTYDGNGDLTDVTDVQGGVTHFTYDGSHRITVMKDPVCQALGGGCPGVQNHYDGNGLVDWQKDQLNRETDFAYSGDPQLATGGTTTITDPQSNVVVDGYVYGVRTFTTHGSGTADASTTYFQYDPDTLALTGVLAPNGSLTTYTVDASGNPLTVTDPLGRVTTNTYNGFNEVLTSQDPKGVTTTYTYDGNGNLTSSSTPATGGSCTCQVVTYNHANGSHPDDVTSLVDPNGKTTYFHYDSNGYQDQVKDPLGNVSGTVHNAIGWVTESYTPKAACTWNSSPPTGCSSTYKTAYSYIIPGGATTDEFGDVQTITDPPSHVTTFGYDADRHKTSVKDGNTNTTSFTFDKAGQLTTATRPDATTQVTDYNDDGTVLDQKDGKGNAIMTYAYDHQARVISTTDALTNVTNYTYDAKGNQTSVSQGSADITYAYDGANQVCWQYLSSSVSGNGCSSPPGSASTYTYDDDGQRTGMVDGTGTSSWSIDNLHRVTSYTNGAGKTVTYGYGSDLKNQVGTIAYPNSAGTVTQTWNDDGTLNTVQDWNGKTTTFGYDANANETSQVVPSTANVTDTFGFNAADELTSVSDSNGSTLFSATYTRDANGQLSTDNSVPGNQGSFKYNSLNQLCYVGSSTSNACSSPPGSSYPYAFDAADNVTTNNGNAQQFNAADELCWTVSGASGNACNSAPRRLDHIQLRHSWKPDQPGRGRCRHLQHL
jgi:YD repeat-containing protein